MAGLRFRVKNIDVSREEPTNLSVDYSSGTTLTVDNGEDFAANDYVVVGNPGEDKTELGRVASATATTIVLNAALNLPHAAGTPIFRSLYNQIAPERKPSGGNYAAIVEGNTEIDFDSKDGFTIISVAAGVTTDTYKWRYYNAASNTYSAYSDELPGTGVGRSSVGDMIAEVRQFGGIPDHKALPDEKIMHYFNDAQDRILTNFPRWYFLQTEATDLTEDGVYKYPIPSDFARMEAVLFNDENVEYRLRYVSLLEFDQMRIGHATNTDSDVLRIYTLLPADADSATGYIGVFPTPASDDLTLTFRYYKKMADLDTFGDTTLVPLPEVLVNFALFQYYKSKENATTADYYYQQYLQGIGMLKLMQRREVGQADFLTWRGHAGRAKMFGERIGAFNDTERELYW